MAYYILKDKVPVECEVMDLMEWAKLDTIDKRRVAYDTLGEAVVSTVFLGLDHSYRDYGKPLLFETMVFGGPLDGEQTRCSTWEEAEVMHATMLEKLNEAIR